IGANTFDAFGAASRSLWCPIGVRRRLRLLFVPEHSLITDLRDPQWWEVYFAPGGGWEHNGGRRQTRIFAEQFTKRFAMRRDSSFSLLDVGCALGDALRHFAETYP